MQVVLRIDAPSKPAFIGRAKCHSILVLQMVDIIEDATAGMTTVTFPSHFHFQKIATTASNAISVNPTYI